MSNIIKLLTVADNVAFSNLFDVEIGASELARQSFNIHLESITIDGMSLEYTINDATKQHQLTKANRMKTISFRVREKGDYYFYKYLLDWYYNFYDPKENRYVKGTNDNLDLPIQGSTQGTIVKNRTVSLKSYGKTNESEPALQIEILSAKIQKLPSTTFDYTSSKPIVYEVGLVCDNAKITLGSFTVGRG